MRMEDYRRPYSDHPQPDLNEKDLSRAIENAFKSRFAQSGKADKDFAEMTALAESIQRSLTNEAGLIGDGYRVRFATSGAGADTVLQTAPPELEIVNKKGQILCWIDGLKMQPAEFELRINQDVVRDRSIFYASRHQGISSLLPALAKVVVASLSEVDYLKRKGPAGAQKFMPGNP